MTNKHTARPTTMTDVDTSSKHIAALVAGMRERGMGLHADYIEALAAERDELERLANEMVERGNAMEADLRMLNNDRGGPVADRINRWYEAQLALTAYQRKEE